MAESLFEMAESLREKIASRRGGERMKFEILEEEHLEQIYQEVKKESYDFSKTYHLAISENNWNPDRPADRERYFQTAYRGVIQKAMITAQRDKTLRDFIQIGEGKCPHTRAGRNTRERKECRICWAELKSSIEVV